MSNSLCPTQSAGIAAAQDRSPDLALRLTALASWIKQAWSVQRQRKALAKMDDRMLADIGLTRAQAHLEANRSFWDLPTV